VDSGIIRTLREEQAELRDLVEDMKRITVSESVTIEDTRMEIVRDKAFITADYEGKRLNLLLPKHTLANSLAKPATNTPFTQKTNLVIPVGKECMLDRPVIGHTSWPGSVCVFSSTQHKDATLEGMGFRYGDLICTAHHVYSALPQKFYIWREDAFEILDKKDCIPTMYSPSDNSDFISFQVKVPDPDYPKTYEEYIARNYLAQEQDRKNRTETVFSRLGMSSAKVGQPACEGYFKVFFRDTDLRSMRVSTGYNIKWFDALPTRFYHDASTIKGASGGIIVQEGLVVGYHCGSERDPDKRPDGFYNYGMIFPYCLPRKEGPCEYGFDEKIQVEALGKEGVNRQGGKGKKRKRGGKGNWRHYKSAKKTNFKLAEEQYDEEQKEQEMFDRLDQYYLDLEEKKRLTINNDRLVSEYDDGRSTRKKKVQNSTKWMDKKFTPKGGGKSWFEMSIEEEDEFDVLSDFDEDYGKENKSLEEYWSEEESDEDEESSIDLCHTVVESLFLSDDSGSEEQDMCYDSDTDSDQSDGDYKDSRYNDLRSRVAALESSIRRLQLRSENTTTLFDQYTVHTSERLSEFHELVTENTKKISEFSSLEHVVSETYSRLNNLEIALDSTVQLVNSTRPNSVLITGTEKKKAKKRKRKKKKKSEEPSKPNASLDAKVEIVNSEIPRPNKEEILGKEGKFFHKDAPRMLRRMNISLTETHANKARVELPPELDTVAWIPMKYRKPRAKPDPFLFEHFEELVKPPGDTNSITKAFTLNFARRLDRMKEVPSGDVVAKFREHLENAYGHINSEAKNGTLNDLFDSEPMINNVFRKRILSKMNQILGTADVLSGEVNKNGKTNLPFCGTRFDMVNMDVIRDNKTAFLSEMLELIEYYLSLDLDVIRKSSPEQLIRLGVLIPIIVTDKDEWHPMRKARTGRWRNIFMVGLAMQVLERLIFDPVVQAYKDQKETVPSATGYGYNTPEQRKEFSDIMFEAFDEIKAQGYRPAFISDDATGFDYSVPCWALKVINDFQIEKMGGGERLSKLAEILFIITYEKSALLLPDGRVIVGCDAEQETPILNNCVMAFQKSGKYKTTTDNSVLRYLLNAYAFQEAAKELKTPIKFKTKTNGDDNVSVVGLKSKDEKVFLKFQNIVKDKLESLGVVLREQHLGEDSFNFCSHFFTRTESYTTSHRKMTANYINNIFKELAEPCDELAIDFDQNMHNSPELAVCKALVEKAWNRRGVLNEPELQFKVGDDGSLEFFF
jgi:hypothetical protein